MSSILIGGIIGAVVGIVLVFLMFYIKDQKFKKIYKTLPLPVAYAALFHYANASRYKKAMKFYDSYGVLYLVGHTVYYKESETGNALPFDMKECSLQMEPDWRMLKWFSITTPSGEKHYFNSQKMGLFKNNSEETLKGFAAIQSVKTN